MPRSPRLPTTIRSASSESTWSRCRTGSSCSSSPGASSRAACTSTNGSRVATISGALRLAVRRARSQQRARGRGRAVDADDDRARPGPGRPRSACDEHRARRLVQEVRRHRAERDPDRAAVSPRTDHRQRRVHALELRAERIERLPSTSRVSDSCNDSVRPAPRPGRAPCIIREPLAHLRRRKAGVDREREVADRDEDERAVRCDHSRRGRPQRRRRRNRPRRRGPRSKTMS